MDYSGNLIFTTRKESPNTTEKLLIHEDILEHHPTVILGTIIQKLRLDFEENDLVIGIDPGQRTGLSIFYYEKEIDKDGWLFLPYLHMRGIESGLKSVEVPITFNKRSGESKSGANKKIRGLSLGLRFIWFILTS